MEKGPKFIGRAYGKEELDKAEKSFKKWAEESAVPIEGEEEKTEEERGEESSCP
ncbi:hypothetical protein HY972_01870 [Candidatus Kaiserbacteria bacterium]|nr:hypothetical protein [Candidatus Kaiserbacteria bacterium]